MHKGLVVVKLTASDPCYVAGRLHLVKYMCVNIMDSHVAINTTYMALWPYWNWVNMSIIFIQSAYSWEDRIRDKKIHDFGIMHSKTCKYRHSNIFLTIQFLFIRGYIVWCGCIPINSLHLSILMTSPATIH